MESIWEAYKKIKADHELPLNLIESDILPRLPVKTLGRFKCVCKQWRLFLSTPTFARMHLHYVNILNDRKLLLLDGQPNFRSFYRLSLNEDGPTAIPNPDPNAEFIIASLDGLVCLALGKEGTKLAFWNPLTRAYKKLPIDPDIPLFYYSYTYDVAGLYIDSSNDYKLLYLANGGEFGAYIYSRRLDSWREVDFLVENACLYTQRRFGSSSWRIGSYSHATFCGQSLYFTVNGNSSRGWILRFDVETEKIREIKFPPVVSGGETECCGSLGVLDGCIHLCVAYKINKDSVQGDMWRMDGDGWVKVSASPGAPSNENWLAILEENNSWANRSSKTLYVETLVSPKL